MINWCALLFTLFIYFLGYSNLLPPTHFMCSHYITLSHTRTNTCPVGRLWTKDQPVAEIST